MKINNSLGVFAPSVVRRKKGPVRRPPWYVEVPPDTVDIALLPRINRYERGGLKFHRFGSTQQKIADRLAIFREAMGEMEPGLGYTEEEMRSGLEEVMRERMLMIEEAEQRSMQRFGELSAAKKVEKRAEPSEAMTLVNLREDAALTEGINAPPSEEPKMTQEAVSDPLVGTPTDWLTRRLQQLDRARG